LEQPNNPDSPDHVKQSPANPAPAPSAGTNGPASSPRRRPDDSAPPAPPLTLTGWLTSNGPYLVIILVLGGWLYSRTGFDGVLAAGKAIIGIGFVIFIHELGHFATAKWCDVHVQTFSIGFGPALPGCSFQYGETTYKLAILPLGGYVNMVGEGPEADEDEDYPRSFKNKTVGQRMLIISAGVIMNVLFGFLCFVIVYRYHGMARMSPVMGRVDPGSRAWEAGVRPGWAVETIDGEKVRSFEDMKMIVSLAKKDKPLRMGLRTLDRHEVVKEIAPRRDSSNLMPMLGVLPAERLKFRPRPRIIKRELPVLYSSAAAFARSFDLRPGDELVKATDPAKGGAVTAVPAGAKGWRELCKRLRLLEGQPVVLEVRRNGNTVSVEGGSGFDWSDVIVATTDPSAPAARGPFAIKELPPAPSPDGKPVQDKAGNALHDPFEFFKRMKLLAGRPAVIQVRRAGSSASDAPVSILVPPQYHVDFGMRMMMGKIAAVRTGSKAEEAGVSKDTIITGAGVLYAGEKSPTWLSEEELDPVRLPDTLASRIYADAKRDPDKWSVVLKVTGGPRGPQMLPRTLPPIAWDASWRFAEEPPFTSSSPLSIPELGIAYRVTSTVAAVKKGSPAEKAGIQVGDIVAEWRERDRAKSKGAEVGWGSWIKLKSTRDEDDNVYDQWGHYFWALQTQADFYDVQVKVLRENKLSEPMTMTAEPDESWPAAERGIRWVLMTDSRRQQASTMWEALTFGVDDTTKFIKRIYLYLSSMLQGNISPRSLGGPIEIASQAWYIAGEDLWDFTLFLGLISVNLAVVNFLPIPVLDGGHMVFLIYEKLRGKPPSENVRAIATYMGLAFILLLLVFVCYVDGKRRGWW
jgi:regulator of sigma E protease